MRLFRSFAFAATLALSALAPRAAYAWDDLGHMVIVRIAWGRLSPAVRDRVTAILSQAPADAGLAELRPEAGGERDFLFAALASTWPDLIRRDEPAARHAYHHGDWHYTNFAWRVEADRTITTLLAPAPNAVNVVEELARLSAVIRDPSTSAAERAVALAWILHLAGDLHQPLHASSRISAADPAGDHGASNFMLDSTTSLHWYWDKVLTMRYPRLEGESRERWVARVADDVLANTARQSSAAAIGSLDFTGWARESLALAQQEVYCCGIAPWQPAPESYLLHADAVAEPRIALAGARLAVLLDQLFAQ